MTEQATERQHTNWITSVLNFFRQEQVFSDVATTFGGITRHWEYTRQAVATRNSESQTWDVDLIESGRYKRIGNDLMAQQVVALFMEHVNTQTYDTWVPERFSIHGEENPCYKGERSKHVTRTLEPGESEFKISGACVSVSAAPRNSFREHPEFAQFAHKNAAGVSNT